MGEREGGRENYVSIKLEGKKKLFKFKGYCIFEKNLYLQKQVVV